MAKKTTFEKLKEMDPEFIGECNKMSEDSLLKRIVTLLEEKEVFAEKSKTDSDIQSLSEQLKTAKETYSVPIKAINLKVKFIIEVLDSRK